MKHLLAAVASACASAVAWAEPPALNPSEEGGTLERSDVISGTEGIRVNDPAFGPVGKVILSGSNTYSGDTVATNGLVELTSVDLEGVPSSIGTSGKVVLGDTVVRFAGDGPMVTDRVFTNFVSQTTGALKHLTVFDLQQDVTFAGLIETDYAAFVKTGPGALIVDGKGMTLGGKLNNSYTRASDYGRQFVLSENGSLPTGGWTKFSLLEGRLVVNSGTMTIRQSGAYSYLGGWTAGSGEQQPDAILEINGGKVSNGDTTVIGFNSGFANFNTPDGPARVIVRVNGGSYASGGGKATYLGPTAAAPSGKTYNTEARIEVHGGSFTANSTTPGLSLSGYPGSHSYIFVDGGTLNANKSTTEGLRTGASSVSGGNATMHMTVCTNGVINATQVYTGYGANNETPFVVDVFDGGVFKFGWMRNGHPEKTTTQINVDGGTIGSYNTLVENDSPVTNWLGASGIRVNVGAKGATFNIGHGNWHSVHCPIGPAPGVVDGGVTVSNAANRVLEFAGAVTYEGPTLVKSGYLSLCGADSSPSRNVLTLTDGGILLRDASRAVSELVLGEEDAATTPRLKVAEGAPLVVTDKFEVRGAPMLKVALVDANGADLTEGRDDVVVLTVPAADKAALEALKVSFDVDSGNGAVASSVVDEGTTCSLKVTTLPQASYNAVWANPNGGSWDDPANWQGGVVPASVPGVAISFPTASAAFGTTVTLSGNVTLGSLKVSGKGPGYRFTGGSFTFDNLGLGATLASTDEARNAIESDLILNEDLTVAYGVSAKRWSYSGRLLGTGRLILGNSGNNGTRTAFAGTDFAADPARVILRPGTCYIYTSQANIDPIANPTFDRIIGGVTFEGASTVGWACYDGSQTVTSGVFATGASHTLTKSGDGILAFGLADGSCGDFPSVSLKNIAVTAGTLAFHSGVATFDALSSSVASGGSNAVLFNGGVLRPRIAAPGKTLVAKFTHAYVGARGLVIDTSDFAPSDIGRYAVTLGQAFERDPALADGAADGGVTVMGANRVSLAAAFSGSTFTGPVTVSPGAGLTLEAGTVAVPGLVLGASAATDPVELGYYPDLDGEGLVVAGALDIRSRVRVAAYRTESGILHDSRTDDAVALITYDPAKNADPDLGLFSRRTESIARKWQFEIVTVASGDHAGWRQVRGRVLGGSDAADGSWSAAQGGAWGDSASWGGVAAPNEVDAVAHFPAADAASVGVVVPSGVTVGLVTFAGPEDPKHGYELTGEPLVFETSVPGTGGIDLQGGQAKFAGIEAKSDIRIFNVTGSVVTVSALTGSGRVVVNDDKFRLGGKTLLGTRDFTGSLQAGSGTVQVDDFGFVKSVGDLVLSCGTLNYTGGSAEIPGFTVAGSPFYANTSALLNLGSGVTLTPESIVSEENSMLALCGKGTLRFRGNGVFKIGTHDVNSNSGTYKSDNRSGDGDGARSAMRSFAIANGTVVIGTLDDPDDAPTVAVGSDFVMAMAMTVSADAVPTFVMNNGRLLTKNFYPCYKHAVNKATWKPTVTVNGGEIDCTGALIAQEPYSHVTMTVNGGRVKATNLGTTTPKKNSGSFTLVQNGGECRFDKVQLANYSSGATDPITVVLKGGTFVCDAGFDFAYSKNPHAVVLQLAGGDFRYGSLLLTATDLAYGRPLMRLNGGIMRPAAAAKVSGIADLYVSTNATTLTTAGYDDGDYEIAQPLMTDPALGGAADGGLVKAGANDLVLSAANTFTGPLVVAEGRVRLATTGSLAGPVALADDATFVIEGTGAEISGLSGRGSVVGSLTTASMRPAHVDGPALEVTGDLTLADGFKLDLDEVAASLKLGVEIPLCRVGGSISGLPPSQPLAGTVGGRKALATFSFANGVFSATLKANGLLLTVR